MKLSKQPISITILEIVILIVVIYLISLLTLKIITRHNKEYVLPDLTLHSVSEAQKISEPLGLVLNVTDSIYLKRMPRGMISRQNPVAGSKVKKGRRILLTINSIKPKLSTVPSLIGFSLRQARTELLSNGLNVGKLEYVKDMATNTVLNQKYDGKDVSEGVQIESESKIDLVLGNNGSIQTYIPKVLGYNIFTAKNIIIDNSLNLHNLYYDTTVKTYQDSLAAVIYCQFPSPSDSISYNLGQNIDLYLTMDKTKIPVPEIEKENNTEK
ncbi:MAG: PASTA domain-containing protein [Bacteroidales bacterium]